MQTNTMTPKPETIEVPPVQAVDPATPLFARLCCDCQHYDADGWGRKLGYPVCLRTMEMNKEANAADLVHGGKVTIRVTTCVKARENESMCGKRAKCFEEITKPVLMVPQWVFDEPQCLRPSLMGKLWCRIQGYFQRANVQV